MQSASTFGSPTLCRETKFIIGFDFDVTLSSPAFFLRSFRHHFNTICRTETADVEQTQMMVFGVIVFDLDFRVQIDSIEQPIKSNSAVSGNMSHCRILITASLSSNTYNKAS